MCLHRPCNAICRCDEKRGQFTTAEVNKQVGPFITSNCNGPHSSATLTLRAERFRSKRVLAACTSRTPSLLRIERLFVLLKLSLVCLHTRFQVYNNIVGCTRLIRALLPKKSVFQAGAGCAAVYISSCLTHPVHPVENATHGDSTWPAYIGKSCAQRLEAAVSVFSYLEARAYSNLEQVFARLACIV